MYPCTYEACRKSYCSAFNLKRHVEAAHLGIRKFKCEICEKSLSSKQNYIDHQFTHTGEKPYICEVPSCEARFRQLSQYFIHLQMHEKASKIKRPKGSKNCILSLLSQRLTEKTKDEDIIVTDPTSVLSVPPVLSSSAVNCGSSPAI